MTDVSWNTILGLIFRRILSIAAGFLLAHGFLVAPDAAGVTVDMFMSVGLAAASGLLSWWQKKGQALAIADAQRAYDHVVAQWRASMKPQAQSVSPAPSVQVKQ